MELVTASCRSSSPHLERMDATRYLARYRDLRIPEALLSWELGEGDADTIVHR
jgi:hypothetical protein